MLLASSQVVAAGVAGTDGGRHLPGAPRLFPSLEDYTLWVIDADTGEVRGRVRL
jgi:hypothetical protein